MNARIHLSDRTEIFNLITLILFIGLNFFRYTNIDKLLGSSLSDLLSKAFLLLSAALIVLFLFVYRKYRKIEIVELFIIVCCMLLSYYKCRNYVMLLNLLWIIASKNIDVDRHIRYMLRVFVSTIAIVIILSLLGVIDMGTRGRLESDITRFAMGFSHPNQLSIMVYVCISMYLLVKHNSLKKSHVVLIVIAGIVTYIITNTTTFAIVLALLVCATWLLNFSHIRTISAKRRRRLIRIGVVLAVFAAAFMIRYLWLHPSIMRDSVYTLWSRFSLTKKYINAYGIGLFGNKIAVGSNISIPGYSTGYFYLDSGLSRLFIEYGIAVTVIVFAAIIMYILRLIRMQDYQILIITICMIVYALTEQKIMAVYINPLIVHIGWTMYNSYGIAMAKDNSAAIPDNKLS